MSKIVIGGHVKSSFIDYPGKVSSVVFLTGCNFRCPYCHNSLLVNGAAEPLSEDSILEYLQKWTGIIDAVCISGGEPTLHSGLSDFIGSIKRLGYLVKLDTNGTNPAMVDELIQNRLIDYIAMDIKAPFGKYPIAAGVNVNVDDIKKSIDIIMNSGCDYEFRTTASPDILSIEDLIEIGAAVKGAKKYAIQNFRDNECVLSGKGHLSSYNRADLEQAANIIKNNVQAVILR